MKITVPSIPSSLPSVDEPPHISPSEIQHIPNGHHGERHVLSPRTRPSFSPWRGKLTINLPVTRKGVERNGGHIPRSGINPRQKSGVLRPRRGIIDAHVDIIPAPAFSRERERENYRFTARLSSPFRLPRGWKRDGCHSLALPGIPFASR